MAAPEKLRKYPGHPEGPVCVSGNNYAGEIKDNWKVSVDKNTKKKKNNTVFKSKKGFIYQRENYYFKNNDIKQNQLHCQ